MTKPLSIAEAKARLGPLLDGVGKGEELFIRRKQRLYRVEEVTEIIPIPIRPPGYFSFDDELSTLADRAIESPV
jgi:antitoxin (DNA-binding transcriptional repressor) of toxin-antitoxin stability system